MSTDIVTVVTVPVGVQGSTIPLAEAETTLLNCVVCKTLKAPAGKVTPI